MKAEITPIVTPHRPRQQLQIRWSGAVHRIGLLVQSPWRKNPQPCLLGMWRALPPSAMLPSGNAGCIAASNGTSSLRLLVDDIAHRSACYAYLAAR